MENTYAMSEPRMGRTRIHKVRKPELLYSPKALKRGRLNDTPKHVLKLISADAELD